MDEQAVIMVQIADAEWTWAALHSACKLARSNGARIALVQTVCVKHPAYLGTEMGYLALGEEDLRNLQAYADTVADYGIDCEVTTYQVYSLFAAVADAVEYVGATFVYARPPASVIPFWSACQFELMRIRLARQNCTLLSASAVQPQSTQPAPDLQLAIKR